MGHTKESILLAALELFARDGYEAVSVSAIAGSLGMTKSALYKHYRSKRDIFDSIVARMEQRDADGAEAFALPTDAVETSREGYAAACVNAVADYAKAQFRYWTQDEFAARFRRMLTLEQYRSEEMMHLYQQYLAAGPLKYLEDLFRAMSFRDPRERAIELYAPMVMLYGVYDGAEDKTAVCSELDACIERIRAADQEEQRRIRMEQKHCVIRLERKEEQREVETLVRESFWNVYRPGCLEHYVLHLLRDDPDFVPELDLVLEKDGKLIGQNVFVRTALKSDDGRSIPIMMMGPICIAPEYKRQGYGKLLLDASLERAAALGAGAVCFEGNIDFYGKSGFTYARTFGLRYHGLPEGEDDSFFLCKELKKGYLDGVSAEFVTPPTYLVDEAKAEEFDAQFPPKEKKRLPGQLF